MSSAHVSVSSCGDALRLARKLRVVLRLRYFFCDTLARILMTGSRRDSETLATIRTLLFGALALGVLGTIGELILLRHIDKPSQWIRIVLLTVRTLPVLSRLNGTLHEETPSFSSCAGHPGGARDHERTMNHVY